MKKLAIIGAGISGLFIGNLFKRNPNYQITIYEKKTSVALEQGYGVQLSVNSIKILNEIGFQKLENSEKFTPEKIDFYFNENLNFKMSNMNMNIKIQYLKDSGKFQSPYWVDKKKLDNYMLPSFTKKIVKYLERN